MFAHERLRGVVRAPWLLWRLLAEGRYDFVYDQMPISLRGMSLPKRWNLLRAGLNLIARRSKPWSLPLHMQFELTDYCQLRCPVCPTGTRQIERPAKALSPELFELAMSEVGPYLLTASLWGWGEPLLHRELDKILAVASRYPVVTFLSTNGQNLNHDRVVEAICSFPPTYLIVALDGLDDETLSEYRHGARVGPAIEGVRRIAEFKRARGRAYPVLHLRFMLMRHNMGQRGDVRHFAAANGFDMFSFRRLCIVDTAEARSAVHQLRPEEAERKSRREKFTCMQPFWFPSLFADGTVVLCSEDYNAMCALGKISHQTRFTALWHDRRAQEMRKRMVRDRALHSFCCPCPIEERGTTDTSFHSEFLSPSLGVPLVVRA